MPFFNHTPPFFRTGPGIFCDVLCVLHAEGMQPSSEARWIMIVLIPHCCSCKYHSIIAVAASRRCRRRDYILTEVDVQAVATND